MACRAMMMGISPHSRTVCRVLATPQLSRQHYHQVKRIRFLSNTRILAAGNASGRPNVVVLPGSSSKANVNPQPIPDPIISITPATPAAPTASRPDSDIPRESIPRTPPLSPLLDVQPPKPNPRFTPPPAPVYDEPPKRRRRGRFRRILMSLIILGGLGFAGGVYYSFESDNFHDFFTEYVPFGEDAVLYFEEREYRKRFPKLNQTMTRNSKDMSPRVTIPSKSGVSWKIAEKEKEATGSKDNRVKNARVADKPTAVKENSDKPVNEKAKSSVSKNNRAENVQGVTAQNKADEKPPAVRSSKSESKAEMAANTSKKATTPTPSVTAENTISSKMPEVDEPSVYVPVKPIDHLKVAHAEDPVVQDLVKIMNDIIMVVNSDGASARYSSSMTKAKDALQNAIQKINGLKSSERSAATEKIQSLEREFDQSARDLVSRLEQEVIGQQKLWREELNEEKERLSRAYKIDLGAATARAKEAAEATAQNALLQQSIALKKDFLDEVSQRVETERDGRLSKLEDLSSSVAELEKLTGDWNAVIDTNLHTQHLQVAVEAVRSRLEKADRPTPFVNELAALKEFSGPKDRIVATAIASINPVAYQRGIPTSAQLIDRFRRVAAEVRKASLLPGQEAGVASHAASVVLSKVMFKKQGLAVGNDVESILTRTETLLEEGRLDAATREMNGLDGWAKTLSWDWLCEARKVLEVRQAIDVIATEARLQGLRVDGN